MMKDKYIVYIYIYIYVCVCVYSFVLVLFLIPTTYFMALLIVFGGTDLRPFLKTMTIISINLIGS